MVRKRTLKQHSKKIKGIEDDVKYIEDQEYEQEQNAKAAKKISKMKNDDLFVINEGKSENIASNRKTLAKDRFKYQNELRSKNERDAIKKLMKHPNLSQKKQKVKKDEMFDLWETPDEVVGARHSKNFKRDREILSRKHDRVKRVVVPLAGQSYNPPAAEHTNIITQVVDEMKDQVKKDHELELDLNPALRPEAKELDETIAKIKEKCVNDALKKGLELVGKIESDSEGEGEDDPDKPTRLSVNPPVIRDPSLTIKGRKKRAAQLKIKHQNIVEKRARQRAHMNRPPTKKKLRENKRRKLEKEKILTEEKEKWETEGVVSRPKKLGLYKYNKPKTDFVPEEQLPDSLRKQRGTENLILDQFDSFYRRNMLPKEAPPGDRKKTKVRQYKEHQTNAEKKMNREEQRRGDQAKKLAQQKLQERKRRSAIAQGRKVDKQDKNEDELIFL